MIKTGFIKVIYLSDLKTTKKKIDCELVQVHLYLFSSSKIAKLQKLLIKIFTLFSYNKIIQTVCDRVIFDLGYTVKLIHIISV